MFCLLILPDLSLSLDLIRKLLPLPGWTDDGNVCMLTCVCVEERENQWRQSHIWFTIGNLLHSKLNYNSTYCVYSFPMSVYPSQSRVCVCAVTLLYCFRIKLSLSLFVLGPVVVRAGLFRLGITGPLLSGIYNWSVPGVARIHLAPKWRVLEKIGRQL